MDREELEAELWRLRSVEYDLGQAREKIESLQALVEKLKIQVQGGNHAILYAEGVAESAERRTKQQEKTIAALEAELTRTKNEVQESRLRSAYNFHTVNRPVNRR